MPSTVPIILFAASAVSCAVFAVFCAAPALSFSVFPIRPSSTVPAPVVVALFTTVQYAAFLILPINSDSLVLTELITKSAMFKVPSFKKLNETEPSSQ